MATSIVIPVHNSEATIGTLVERLLGMYAAQDLEVVLVDDGSTDASARVCEELADGSEGRVVFIQLARNFGEHNAVMAGLAHTQGDAVVVMDDDLQNPPEAVDSLLEAMRTGDYDVVYSRFPEKRHRLWRNAGSWINNLFATILVGKPYGLYLSSFKAMSRFAVDEVVRYQGPFPYIDGLILQSVNRIGTVTVQHGERAVGKSSYTLRRLIGLWLNVFTNFSVVPLRIAFILGLLGFAAGLVLIGVFVQERFTTTRLPTGFLSLMTTMVFFSSSILVGVGLMGEYIGRILLNVNGKPQFVVRRVVGHRAVQPRTEA